MRATAEPSKVADVKNVADLLSGSAVADVGQRPAENMMKNPQSDDSLINLAHLPWASDNAAAVDDRLKTKRSSILLDQAFAGELGKTVERSRAGHREVFRNTGCGYPGNAVIPP